MGGGVFWRGEAAWLLGGRGGEHLRGLGGWKSSRGSDYLKPHPFGRWALPGWEGKGRVDQPPSCGHVKDIRWTPFVTSSQRTAGPDAQERFKRRLRLSSCAEDACAPVPRPMGRLVAYACAGGRVAGASSSRPMHSIRITCHPSLASSCA